MGKRKDDLTLRNDFLHEPVLENFRAQCRADCRRQGSGSLFAT
jgi:hypothetical protein